MAAYQIKDVSFYYPNSSTPALHHISASVEVGDFVLVGGPTGSGKTTLLRLLKKQVEPAGTLDGKIHFNGDCLQDLSDKDSAEKIGMVFQDPDHQIIMHTVRQELCYGMENLGYSSSHMQKRMAEVVPFFGMRSWLHQTVDTLSGGQKQLLNLAAAMMLRPRVLILDEPTAQLDPVAASEFMDLLVRINQELSVTVILSEHRLGNLYSHANRVLFMRKGTLAFQGTPGEVIHRVWKEKDSDFLLYLPSVSRLYLKMEKSNRINAQIPTTVKGGKQWFNRYCALHGSPFNQPVRPGAKESPGGGDILLDCDSLSFQYDKNALPVLKHLSCQLQSGDFFVLLGGNGSGKSTLLKLIAGILDVQRGSIRYRGTRFSKVPLEVRRREIGYVAQNPLAYFTRDTVGGQLKERADILGLGNDSTLQELVDRFHLQPVLEKHPFDISGGEQQKLVLALVLMANPELLLMDEPTKGLDPVAKKNLAHWLHQLRGKGKTIFMVSHDIEFAAEHASQCGLLFDGNVMAHNSPTSFFTENFYYTTMIHRIVRENLPEEISEEGVLARWSDSENPFMVEA